MSGKAFEAWDAIVFGWNCLKANPGFFAVIMIIAGALQNPSMLAPIWIAAGHYYSGYIDSSPHSLLLPAGVISILAGGAIYLAVELGLIGIALSFRNGRTPEIRDLFRFKSNLLNFIAASIAYYLMVGVGLFLLVVPGIYIALKYQFYGYIIADRGIGPVEALKESGRMTEGVKMDLLVFWLTLFASIVVIGFILYIFTVTPASLVMQFRFPEHSEAFFAAIEYARAVVGVMVIAPITKLSLAFIYRVLEGRSINPAPVPGDAQPGAAV